MSVFTQSQINDALTRFPGLAWRFVGPAQAQDFTFQQFLNSLAAQKAFDDCAPGVKRFLNRRAATIEQGIFVPEVWVVGDGLFGMSVALLIRNFRNMPFKDMTLGQAIEFIRNTTVRSDPANPNPFSGPFSAREKAAECREEIRTVFDNPLPDLTANPIVEVIGDVVTTVAVAVVGGASFGIIPAALATVADISEAQQAERQAEREAAAAAEAAQAQLGAGIAGLRLPLGQAAAIVGVGLLAVLIFGG